MGYGTKAAVVLAGTLVVVLFAATSQGTVLLYDNFNNANEAGSYSGTDFGVSKELATRQSGIIGTMTYTRYDGGAGWNGATQVYNGGTWSNGTPKALDFFCYGGYGAPYVVGTYDFSSDMTISAMLNPMAGAFEGTDPTGWVAMSTRLNTATPGAVSLIAQTGLSLKVQANGGITLLVNGVAAYSGSVTAANSYNTSMTLQGNLLSVSVNGLTLDLNGALAGNNLVFNGGSSLHNYVGFSAGTSVTGAHVSTVDDLMIQTPTVTLLPPSAAPGLALTPNSTLINTNVPGGSTASVIYTTALTSGEQPDSGTVTFGDTTSAPLTLPLSGDNAHDYVLGVGVNSQTFNASVSASNNGGPGSANASVTVLRAPVAVVTVNGIAVNDGDVLTIYGLNAVTISAAGSLGFIESFELTNGSTVLSGTSSWSGLSNDLYGGTITFQAANTGSGANTSRVRFSVVPEPASLALLGLGALAMLRRRK